MTSGSDDVTTWFTSDLHLGHPLVSDVRGFGHSDADVARHDEHILTNLMDHLTDGDTLWILGDISSGWRPQEEAALQLLDATLRGPDAPELYIHLVSGNHDSTHPIFADAYLRQRRFLEIFDSVQSMQMRPWGDHEVWMSHFPRPGQDHIPGGSRHDELRLVVPLLLHGHLHSEKPVTGPGQVDVGQDPWGFKPVAEEEVMDVLFTETGWRPEKFEE